MNTRIIASARADLVILVEMQQARASGGEGYAIELARAFIRAASAELAEASGPESAIEETYRAADELLRMDAEGLE